MKTFLLAEGIRLHVFKEERYKSEYLSINFLSPDSLSSVDAASLFPFVISLATKNYPIPKLWKQKMEDAYNTSVIARQFQMGETVIQSFSTTWIHDSFLPHKLHTLPVDLLIEMLLNPLVSEGGFSKEYTQRQRQIKIDDIEAVINNKERLAVRRCLRTLCENEAFIRTPTVENTKKLDEKTLYSYYLKLIEEAPIEIYYFGKTDGELLFSYLKEKLSPLFSKKKGLSKDLPSVPKKEVRRIEEFEEVTQAKLSMGFKTDIVDGHPLYIAYKMLRELLVDSPTSRLFMNVREKKSLFYSCSALPEPSKGVLLLTFGIDSADAKETEKAVMKELADLQNGDFTMEELQNSVVSLENYFMEAIENPLLIESYYLRQHLVGTSIPMEEQPKLFHEVTKEQIMEAAKHLKLDTVYIMKQKGGESK